MNFQSETALSYQVKDKHKIFDKRIKEKRREISDDMKCLIKRGLKWREIDWGEKESALVDGKPA